MSDTPKTDALFDYLRSLTIKENQAVIAYARRLQASSLGMPTVEMVKDFVAVFRSENPVAQHLQGDGFDFIQA